MSHSTLVSKGEHYGLTFLTTHMTTPGAHAEGAVPKIVWHTTEGHGTVPGVAADLVARKVEPHFVLDPIRREVSQIIPLDNYARALEHPQGTPETNRAGCVQVEVIGFANMTPKWDDHILESLAGLALVIEHRTGVFRVNDKEFTAKPNRVKPENWLGAHGHFGHEHVPSQPAGHWDPGALDIRRVFQLMRRL